MRILVRAIAEAVRALMWSTTSRVGSTHDRGDAGLGEQPHNYQIAAAI